nr:MAG: hypothetical protein [Chemarfal virus 235]
MMSPPLTQPSPSPSPEERPPQLALQHTQREGSVSPFELSARQDIGLPPSPSPAGLPLLRQVASTLLDNLNEEREDIDTGNLWSPSPRRRLWPRSEESLTGMDTSNQRDQELRRSTSIRRTLASEILSSSDLRALTGTLRQTGRVSDYELLLDNLPRFPRISLFVITGISKQFARTLCNQVVWSDHALSTGVRLRLASRTELGPRPGMMLTLKIRVLNSGVGTRISRILSSTNLEEQSTYRTYCDGSISIRSEWKSRDLPSPSWLQRFGSLRTSVLWNGTLY